MKTRKLTPEQQKRKTYLKRLRYQKYKLLGLCTICGHEKERPEILMCNRCNEKHKKRRARYRYKNTEKCRQQSRKYRLKQIKYRLENNLCRDCGRDLTELYNQNVYSRHYNLCIICIQKNSEKE